MQGELNDMSMNMGVSTSVSVVEHAGWCDCVCVCMCVYVFVCAALVRKLCSSVDKVLPFWPKARESINSG